MTQNDILAEQTRLTKEKRSYATVTIVSAGGSTPRSSGKMIVYEGGGTYGTVGGGAVERAAERDAVNCIRRGENRMAEYDLKRENEGLGMICGGTLSVYIEVFRAAPRLVMCGAGHVGAALIKLAQFMGFYVTLIDDRDTQYIAEAVERADEFIRAEDFESAVRGAQIAPGAYFVIATFGHSADGEALFAAMGKQPAYIGMIGSHIKIDTLFSKLRARGVTEEALKEIYTPIGLDTGGETPEEIALSVMAEIEKIRFNKTGRHLRDIRREAECIE